jgi:hypothetical protein
VTGSADWYDAKGCLPNNVTVETIRDILIRWLDQDPEKRTKSGREVVLGALEDAYPCKR